MLVAAFAGFFGAAFSGSMIVGVLVGVAPAHRHGRVPRVSRRSAGGSTRSSPASSSTSSPRASRRSTSSPARSSPRHPQRRRPDPLGDPAHRRDLLRGPQRHRPRRHRRGGRVHLALFHTRWGLRTRAVGEYPSAADTAGINVERLRLVNVTLAGSLAGLAGVLPLDGRLGLLQRGITAGRGFLALAIMIFGAGGRCGPSSSPSSSASSTPSPPAPAVRARPGRGQRGHPLRRQRRHVAADPRTLPYVATLVVLAVAAGRVAGTGGGRPALREEGPVMSNQTPEVPDVHVDPEAAVGAHLDTSRSTSRRSSRTRRSSPCRPSSPASARASSARCCSTSPASRRRSARSTPTTTSPSTCGAARSSLCSARTAPASRRWSTRSSASSRPTTATDRRSRATDPHQGPRATPSAAASAWCTSTSSSCRS